MNKERVRIEFKKPNSYKEHTINAIFTMLLTLGPITATHMADLLYEDIPEIGPDVAPAATRKLCRWLEQKGWVYGEYTTGVQVWHLRKSKVNVKEEPKEVAD